jgi:hypothetical protein
MLEGERERNKKMPYLVMYDDVRVGIVSTIQAIAKFYIFGKHD